MVKPGYRIFILDERVDSNLVLREAAALFPGTDETMAEMDDQYLDSFDWRMYTGSMVIRRNGPQYSVAPLFGFSAGREVSGPDTRNVFWWDFPEGEIRDTLKSLLGDRALTPLFRLVGRRWNLQFRNRDQKIVARLTLDSGEVIADGKSRTAIPTVLQLTEVRGYRKPFLRILKLFKALGLEEATDGKSFLSVVLGVIGRLPGDYSSKFSVKLKPEQTLDQAVSIIGLNLQQSMERNLPGVLDDVDSEFLHDFRVAVRRTRSALSQLKKAIPPGQRTHFSQEFKWLGGVTGPVRDIDVCLKNKEVFKTLVPPSLHQGLERLFRQIHRQRKKELAKMQKGLQSSRFVDLMANWHEFLLEFPGDVHRPVSKKACGKVAHKTIGKCYRNLVHYASLVMDGEDQDQDSSMHELRIQGKKFRYLVEFFRSLFPEDTMGNLLKEMKGLQNDLGEFNDLSVQVGNFKRYLAGASQIPLVEESVKELIARLETRKKQMRRKCLRRCKQFMDRNMKDLFGESLKKETG